MKRQATLRSSSSIRETETSTVHHVANSVGCMAGVFSLISSKYRTRRKFLTFGKKQQEKQLTRSSSSSTRETKLNSPVRKARSENRRLSCEVPRSPTITPEIRRSNSLNSPEAFRSPVTSVVARLMGLEDAPPPQVTESAVEKRRKLLGALEKCDEDLQALKRIIESVQCTDRPKSQMMLAPFVTMKKSTEPVNGISEEQPSPVSVLEDICDSPTPSWQNSPTKRTQNDMCRLERVSPLQLQRKKPWDENLKTTNFHFHNNNNRLDIPKSDESMEEAVNDVCKDVETGHKREIERLGMVIEDFIYRDLIVELTKDLMGRRSCHVEARLPFDKCKRKLRF